MLRVKPRGGCQRRPIRIVAGSDFTIQGASSVDVALFHEAELGKRGKRKGRPMVA
jgi:hypothetical protein